MTHRPNNSFRPPLQAPAALRIGLPHLLVSSPKRRIAADQRHATYVRLRELRFA
ncbi:hypothetical protein [Maricaulis sp.]|uniref:hypothetical protein n=1 Tax=Maricaulis sp. TaxID=1486257 RepID=UPI0025BD9622|nr:hypothetical protein [Maricaulis sp.]